jgi:hypothetical protein
MHVGQVTCRHSSVRAPGDNALQPKGCAYVWSSRLFCSLWLVTSYLERRAWCDLAEMLQVLACSLVYHSAADR